MSGIPCIRIPCVKTVRGLPKNACQRYQKNSYFQKNSKTWGVHAFQVVLSFFGLKSAPPGAHIPSFSPQVYISHTYIIFIHNTYIYICTPMFAYIYTYILQLGSPNLTFATPWVIILLFTTLQVVNSTVLTTDVSVMDRRPSPPSSHPKWW